MAAPLNAPKCALAARSTPGSEQTRPRVAALDSSRSFRESPISRRASGPQLAPFVPHSLLPGKRAANVPGARLAGRHDLRERFPPNGRPGAARQAPES
jgi:hypothetical protein